MAQDLFNELDEIFNEVKDKETLFENLPDGEYLATLIEAYKGLSKSSEQPMVTFVFEINHGEFKGRQHRKFLPLAGKDERMLRGNLHRYASEIKKFGISTKGSIEDTFTEVEKLKNVDVKLTIETKASKKTGKEFTNTTIEVI